MEQSKINFSLNKYTHSAKTFIVVNSKRIFKIPIILSFFIAIVVISVVYVAYVDSLSFRKTSDDKKTTPINASNSAETQEDSPINKESTGTKYFSPTVAPTHSLPTISTSILKVNTPTLSPTSRVPSPPVINIIFPTEGQNVVFNDNQKFCTGELLVSGDGTNSQRKSNINNAGWTSYAVLSDTCFEPKEGSNVFSIQYKNQYGDESAVYTRNFTFHRGYYITVSLTGTVFSDADCSGGKSSSELGVPNVTVNIYQPPDSSIFYGTTTTDSNGNYNFSTSILDSASLLIRPIAVVPSGYTAHPTFQSNYGGLSLTNKVVAQDLPIIPPGTSCQ